MSKLNLARKLIESHLVEGETNAGQSIAIRIDQTLTQDATGTLVMQEFEAMKVGRVRTEVSAQYVDHNLLQADFKNPDDHLFLRSACRRFGVWFSRPGTGVSHAVHMERFGRPGRTLLGSDSHSCAAGSMGMLAIGAGGLEVALAMAGRPFYLKMPKIMGVRLSGRLPDWVSAKDVILEMLRRHDVDGGIGRIIEYHGPGLAHLGAMDRHVIANMGAELGATATVFPADEAVRRFLASQGREDQFEALAADENADYDEHDEIDLSTLEPLIALPSSPGKVVPVAEVAGREVYQCYIGSSANPGLRDLAVAAMIVDGRSVHDRVSFDINPASRQILENLSEMGLLNTLIHAGARLHQTGCNGCIGMGQAPASGRISLRTVPRNFPGRSGTEEDQVYLCSPETAAASALSGTITDPRTLDRPYPKVFEPERLCLSTLGVIEPEDQDAGSDLEMGPNIVPLPDAEALPDALRGPALLKLGDDVSTDEIMPAGSRVLPFRSNIPAISRFVFAAVDGSFPKRAEEARDRGAASFLIGGDNYGQGSSREHAALAPRYLGVRAVLAKGFARIHWQNLCNFGILPLQFADPQDYDTLQQGDELHLEGVREALESGETRLTLHNHTRDQDYALEHALSERQIAMILCGGLLNLMREELAA
ncbi:aconitate hydratase [Algiphilus sp. W345]|uniref:Aconitate hydratase n=1 Tax=Banduia mediterranea TaxID=3075609 RepID=A0ABU2WH88_9GAMM|nr:aconitate hydratase [Algiphilus sp. W345]MDT0496915.1 aconitate hydratase [Algiphilus sp. W345]